MCKSRKPKQYQRTNEVKLKTRQQEKRNKKEGYCEKKRQQLQHLQNDKLHLVECHFTFEAEFTGSLRIPGPLNYSIWTEEESFPTQQQQVTQHASLGEQRDA